MNQNITCLARLRPLLGEAEEKESIGVSVDKSTLSIKSLNAHYGAKQFKMSADVLHNVDQQAVFASVMPHLEKALLGYNTSFFTYGPTGTGKTYTTLGYDFSAMLDRDTRFASSQGSPSKRSSVSPQKADQRSPSKSPSKRLSSPGT